jgi:hypothetical protein
MANTYTLIASNVLGSSAASVTFSAIPATYTDLVLRYSARSSRTSDLQNVYITFNASTSSDYSQTDVKDFGVTILSTRASNDAKVQSLVNGAPSTANTFSNNEIYIANYAGSTNKVFSVVDCCEANSTSDFTNARAAKAALRSNTAAITEIKLDATLGSSTFLSGSSFYLYGIKKD